MTFKDVFVSLEAIELATGNIKVFDKAACGFGYRHSVFKGPLEGAFIILNVTIKLVKHPQSFCVNYGTIKATLQEMGVTKLSVQAISQAVIRIRQNKLPNANQLGNAGSFFKNPMVSQAHFSKLKETYPMMVGYKMEDGSIKLSAAWLIAQLGCKRKGSVGVYPLQPLVLVDYGGATGVQMYRLAQTIQVKVLDQFEVTLVPEVNIIGIS